MPNLDDLIAEARADAALRRGFFKDERAIHPYREGEANQTHAIMDRLADALEAATVEAEWEYRAIVEWSDRGDPRRFPNFYLGGSRPFTEYEMKNPAAFHEVSGGNTLEGAYLTSQERRRKAGPWLPVEGESK